MIGFELEKVLAGLLEAQAQAEDEYQNRDFLNLIIGMYANIWTSVQLNWYGRASREDREKFEDSNLDCTLEQLIIRYEGFVEDCVVDSPDFSQEELDEADKLIETLNCEGYTKRMLAIVYGFHLLSTKS